MSIPIYLLRTLDKNKTSNKKHVSSKDNKFSFSVHIAYCTLKQVAVGWTNYHSRCFTVICIQCNCVSRYNYLW